VLGYRAAMRVIEGRGIVLDPGGITDGQQQQGDERFASESQDEWFQRVEGSFVA
jgi:hypothetical protein